jgi:sugar phosphate isomerase/epimerase
MITRRSLLASLPALGLPSGAAPGPARARLRTAICAYSFRRELKAGTMSYQDLVRLAVDCEVDGLDLTVYWFPSTSPDFLLPLRLAAYKNGVEIYSISIRTDMCRPTAELRAKEVEEIQRWVDVAALLGAGHIRVFGGNVPRGESEERAAGWVAEILRRAAEYSSSKGVILGLENHGGITLRAERIIEIVRMVDSPWVGINLDTGNFRGNSYEQIALCVPHAVNVQYKIDMRDEQGRVEPADWERITGLLAEGGYKGYLALEYEGEDDAVKAVPPLLARLNEVAAKYSQPRRT